MDIFIYFDDALPCGMDELEDALEEILGNRGEVTGTGLGEKGGNIDIEVIEACPDKDRLLTDINKVLVDMGANESTVIRFDGNVRKLGDHF